MKDVIIMIYEVLSMKKICILLLMSIFVCSISSGCATKKQKPNMVQAQRRFAKYMAPQQTPNGSIIDLSEGPKQNYDAKFGPQSVNFDITIVDPY